MTTMSQGQLDMVRAFFCNEVPGGLAGPYGDAGAHGRCRCRMDRRAVHQWTVRASGVHNISAVWCAEPESMTALLVGEIDEIAVKRHEAAAVAYSGADLRVRSRQLTVCARATGIRWHRFVTITRTGDVRRRRCRTTK